MSARSAVNVRIRTYMIMYLALESNLKKDADRTSILTQEGIDHSNASGSGQLSACDVLVNTRLL